MWKRFFPKDIFQKSIIIIPRISRSSSIFTNELLRERLTPYIDKISYVDELSKTLPKLKQHRKASVLLPLYCNEKTNRVEILLLKRSDKVRSHTGLVAFAGGMSDPTDRDTIHTAEREAYEEIGLKPEHYSTLGCLPPVTDNRIVMITPVVALLHSPKFVDFRLLLAETTDAFYLDLEQFLYVKNNYKMTKVADHFATHHFHIDKYHIWGVTAYELIIIAMLVFKQLPDFPFFRHGEQLDLKLCAEQLKKHFQLCVEILQEYEIKKEYDETSRLKK